MIIAAQIEEQIPATVEGIGVVRLGMDPALAAQYNAPTAAATGQSIDNAHAKSGAWMDACRKHGVSRTTTYQAEALDYATWAEIIGETVEDRLAGRPVNDSVHDPDFVNADRILSAVKRLADGSALEEIADRLELEDLRRPRGKAR
jgi:hypothetical protein